MELMQKLSPMRKERPSPNGLTKVHSLYFKKPIYQTVMFEKLCGALIMCQIIKLILQAWRFCMKDAMPKLNLVEVYVNLLWPASYSIPMHISTDMHIHKGWGCNTPMAYQYQCSSHICIYIKGEASILLGHNWVSYVHIHTCVWNLIIHYVNLILLILKILYTKNHLYWRSFTYDLSCDKINDFLVIRNC